MNAQWLALCAAAAGLIYLGVSLAAAGWFIPAVLVTGAGCYVGKMAYDEDHR